MSVPLCVSLASDNIFWWWWCRIIYACTWNGARGERDREVTHVCGLEREGQEECVCVTEREREKEIRIVGSVCLWCLISGKTNWRGRLSTFDLLVLTSLDQLLLKFKTLFILLPNELPYHMCVGERESDSRSVYVCVCVWQSERASERERERERERL